jgi:hypothetical protein
MGENKTHRIMDIVVYWPPSVSAGSYGPGGTIGFDAYSSVITAASLRDNLIVLDITDKGRQVATALQLKYPEMADAVREALLLAKEKTLREFGSMEIRF